VRKALITLLSIAVCGIILAGTYYVYSTYYVYFWESPEFTKYRRIQVGMSVEEVQAILGPGTALNQTDVPTFVVAVNPKDAEAAKEKARRSGLPSPTTRDYPIRHQYVVEGDSILQWIGRTGERILVAFKGGEVCQKDYWEPSL